ncbi:MAG: chorismate mutase [archaeon]
MELEDLRKQIDELDELLLEVMSKRLSLMPRVAEIKRCRGIDIDQQDRERQLVENIRRKAKQKGLDPDFIERIITEIIKESKSIQKKNM